MTKIQMLREINPKADMADQACANLAAALRGFMDDPSDFNRGVSEGVLIQYGKWCWDRYEWDDPDRGQT